MIFWDGLVPTVTLELTSADPQGVLDEILRNGLSIFSVYRVDELVTVFTAKASESAALRSMIGKRGDRIKIVHEKGARILLARLKRRPLLLLGFAFILFLALLLPTRILLFRVEGEKNIPAARILEQMQDMGIGFWTKRADVKNEDIKNGLISRIPQIEWVGINTKGCVATVSIRERDPVTVGAPSEPGSIYASRDGVISSITASRGTALCAPGDAVLEGQILISGYTDSGDILLLEAAEGEVHAYTSREAHAIMPVKCSAAHPTGRIHRRISLSIGKKRINLWKGSGISPAGCDRMYRRYWLMLPGGETLPVSIIVESIIFRDTILSETAYGEADIDRILEQDIHSRIPGGKILHRELSFSRTDEHLILYGRYGCLEMIGKKTVEQIGENVWQEQ